MSNIDRYWFDVKDCRICSDGEYVLYKDHKADNDRLREALENDYEAFESIMDNVLEPDKITCLVEPRKHKIKQALKGE